MLLRHGAFEILHDPPGAHGRQPLRVPAGPPLADPSTASPPKATPQRVNTLEINPDILQLTYS
jgi:hypothetical protein